MLVDAWVSHHYCACDSMGYNIWYKESSKHKPTNGRQWEKYVPWSQGPWYTATKQNITVRSHWRQFLQLERSMDSRQRNDLAGKYRVDAILIGLAFVKYWQATRPQKTSTPPKPRTIRKSRSYILQREVVHGLIKLGRVPTSTGRIGTNGDAYISAGEQGSHYNCSRINRCESFAQRCDCS